jgi:hypothetical protein
VRGDEKALSGGAGRAVSRCTSPAPLAFTDDDGAENPAQEGFGIAMVQKISAEVREPAAVYRLARYHDADDLNVAATIYGRMQCESQLAFCVGERCVSHCPQWRL